MYNPAARVGEAGLSLVAAHRWLLSSHVRARTYIDTICVARKLGTPAIDTQVRSILAATSWLDILAPPPQKRKIATQSLLMIHVSRSLLAATIHNLPTLRISVGPSVLALFSSPA